MRRARHDPQARAALHGWLHEFEARMYYGLEGRNRLGRRGSLVGWLVLVLAMFAAVAVLLDRWIADPIWFLFACEFLLVLAYVVVRRMLRPLWRLGFGVAAFGRGDLKHRIPVQRHDEIGALVMRFNRMADDIVGMLDAKRGLLLAISHELKSPITRVRLHAELLEEGPTRDAMVADMGLMRDLIDGLIERERLDAGHSALLLQAADWAAWAEALIEQRFAAQRSRLRLEISSDLPAQQLDRMRVELLLGNLLDNALRHDPQGSVLLSVQREGQGVRLTVRDHGPGVPAEALEKLGEPFYRPEESRSRASGGIGLGLSLCKLIAKAHGAELEIENAQPGLRVSVLFPLA